MSICVSENIYVCASMTIHVYILVCHNILAYVPAFMSVFIYRLYVLKQIVRWCSRAPQTLTLPNDMGTLKIYISLPQLFHFISYLFYY